jgi:hypothetical protein
MLATRVPCDCALSERAADNQTTGAAVMDGSNLTAPDRPAWLDPCLCACGLRAALRAYDKGQRAVVLFDRMCSTRRRVRRGRQAGRRGRPLTQGEDMTAQERHPAPIACIQNRSAPALSATWRPTWSARKLTTPCMLASHPPNCAAFLRHAGYFQSA